MITCFYPDIQLKWDSTPKKYSFFERRPIQPRQLALEVATLSIPWHGRTQQNELFCGFHPLFRDQVNCTTSLSVISGTIRFEGWVQEGGAGLG